MHGCVYGGTRRAVANSMYGAPCRHKMLSCNFFMFVGCDIAHFPFGTRAIDNMRVLRSKLVFSTVKPACTLPRWPHGTLCLFPVPLFNPISEA